MQILLTGASGNIGTSALHALVERGHHVRALIPHSRASIAGRYRRHPQVDVFPGDVRDAARMRRAVADQDVVIHLAYILPPESDERPALARAVNLDGTRNLIAACRQQPTPPRFLFASTFDLFGHTGHLPPPRRVDDPVAPTDLYTEHKLQGERWVRESGLVWSILRFADVPVMGFRRAHPIMFEIPLAQRFEVLHTLDAGLATVNTMTCDAAWGRILLIGGGASCQVTYRDFLFGLLGAMGIGDLPAAAFTTRPYCTDWLDTAESQALLDYQRHSFADIVREIRAVAGWRRGVIPLVRPVVRRAILRMSPYLNRPPASE
jgi:nucleoside-diphosphate-sugar epimerase